MALQGWPWSPSHVRTKHCTGHDELDACVSYSKFLSVSLKLGFSAVAAPHVQLRKRSLFLCSMISLYLHRSLRMHLVPHSLWQKQPVGQRAFVHAHDARSSADAFRSPQHKRSSEPRTLLRWCGRPRRAARWGDAMWENRPKTLWKFWLKFPCPRWVICSVNTGFCLAFTHTALHHLSTNVNFVPDCCFGP